MAKGERIQAEGMVFYSNLMNKKNLLHREKLIDVQANIAKHMWSKDIAALTQKLSPRYDHMPHVVIMDNPGGGMGKSTILLPSLEMSLSVQNDDMPVVIPSAFYVEGLGFELPAQSKSIVLFDEDNMMPKDEVQFEPFADILRSKSRTVLWPIPTVGTETNYSQMRDMYIQLFQKAGIQAELYTPHPNGMSTAHAHELLSCFRLGDQTGFYSDLLDGLKIITPRLLDELVTYAHAGDPFDFILGHVESESRRLFHETDLPFVANFFGLDLPKLIEAR